MGWNVVIVSKSRYVAKWVQDSLKTNSHNLFIVLDWHFFMQCIVLAIFFIIIWCSFVLLEIVLKIYMLEKDNFADLELISPEIMFTGRVLRKKVLKKVKKSLF